MNPPRRSLYIPDGNFLTDLINRANRRRAEQVAAEELARERALPASPLRSFNGPVQDLAESLRQRGIRFTGAVDDDRDEPFNPSTE